MYDETVRLKKNYAPGKYRTVVIVYEGTVVNVPYDEKGMIKAKARIMHAGDKSRFESEIGEKAARKAAIRKVPITAPAPQAKPEVEKPGKVIPSEEAIRGLLQEKAFQQKMMQLQMPTGMGGVPGATIAPEKPVIEKDRRERKEEGGSER